MKFLLMREGILFLKVIHYIYKGKSSKLEILQHDSDSSSNTGEQSGPLLVS